MKTAMASFTATFDRTKSTLGAREFLLKRVNELIGTLLFIASLVFYLVLATYDRTDPSWNMAIDKVPANFGGPIGAVLADALIQSVGAASVVFPTVLAVWALRLLLHLPIRMIWLRLLALPVLMLAVAISLGVLPGMAGGVLGHLFWLKVTLGAATAFVAMGFAALSGLMLVFILGLSWLEWQEVGRGAGKVARVSGKAGLTTWKWSARAAAPVLRQAPSFGLNRPPREPAIKPKQRTEPQMGSQTGVGTARETAPEDDGMVSTELPRFLTAAGAPARRELPRDVVAPKPAGPAPGKRAEAPRQASLDLEPKNRYELPPLDLLAEPPKDRGRTGPSEEALQQNALLLLSVLEDFGVKGEIVKVRPGPVVTLYELEPAPGTKSSRVIGLADDIARSMSAVSVRVAVVPGRNVIGIELPNAKSETVYLHELLASDAYERNTSKLSLVLGKDIGGGPIIADLAKMPHLLIAGYHRLGQIGRHQHHDPVGAVPDAAGSVQIHHDRPQDAGAVDL
ncbi:MAG: DNA translocase FtsK 4TM domain-containing protein [Aliidongia sp.]